MSTFHQKLLLCITMTFCSTAVIFFAENFDFHIKSSGAKLSEFQSNIWNVSLTKAESKKSKNRFYFSLMKTLPPRNSLAWTLLSSEEINVRSGEFLVLFSQVFFSDDLWRNSRNRWSSKLSLRQKVKKSSVCYQQDTLKWSQSDRIKLSSDLVRRMETGEVKILSPSLKCKFLYLKSNDLVIKSRKNRLKKRLPVKASASFSC